VETLCPGIKVKKFNPVIFALFTTAAEFDGENAEPTNPGVTKYDPFARPENE
jgi:hypothetical protein